MANRRMSNDRICSLPECGRNYYGLGYCEKHYQNFKRNGEPIGRVQKSAPVVIAERPWIVTDEGCWEWQGPRNDSGYGRLNHKRDRGESDRAHRAVYEVLVGPVPDGLLLRHTCDNRPCVNPSHLIPGTSADNARDMAERGRRKRAFCPAGHDRSLPGATKVVRRAGKPDEFACVECARERSRRWAAEKRKSRAA